MGQRKSDSRWSQHPQVLKTIPGRDGGKRKERQQRATTLAGIENDTHHTWVAFTLPHRYRKRNPAGMGQRKSDSREPQHSQVSKTIPSRNDGGQNTTQEGLPQHRYRKRYPAGMGQRKSDSRESFHLQVSKTIPSKDGDGTTVERKKIDYN